MKRNPEALVRAYLDAIATKRLDELDALLAPDVRFVGPMSNLTGLADVKAAFRRVSSIHVKSDIERLFTDGDEVCVIYDFVTDTIGGLPTVEWIHLRDGRIQSIRIYYDQVPFQRAREEIARRMQAAAQPNA